MTKREAYQAGKRNGDSAATYCEVTSTDRAEAHCTCQTGGGPFECEECLTIAAFESEQHARDLSPWEHLAHAINSSRDPDGLWEAHDAGVARGIKLGVARRLKGVHTMRAAVYDVYLSLRQARKVAKAFGVRAPRVGYEVCLGDEERVYLSSTGHAQFGWFENSAPQPFRLWAAHTPVNGVLAKARVRLKGRG